MARSNDHRSRRNRAVATRLAVLTLAMFGFGFALVPLYDVFCEITGLNGKTGRVEAAALDGKVDTSRTITVEFISSINASLHWDVKPSVASMKVHPGKIYETTYFARNLGNDVSVGQAVPSVSPGKAAIHFNKTECFCFTKQRFEGHESREMPVRFVIGTDVPEQVRTVTLAYTFYEVGEGG